MGNKINFPTRNNKKRDSGMSNPNIPVSNLQQQNPAFQKPPPPALEMMMDYGDQEPDIIIKCSREEMMRHFFKDYTVVWHDPSVHSPENQELRTYIERFCEIQAFTEWEKAFAYVNETQAICYVITSGTNGELLVKQIFDKQNVSGIYIFCRNQEYHSTWAKKYPKVVCIETYLQNIVNHIQYALLQWYKEASSLRLNLPAFAPIFNDTDKSTMNNLHRYLKVIPNFKNRLQAKCDVLNLSRAIYSDAKKP